MRIWRDVVVAEDRAAAKELVRKSKVGADDFEVYDEQVAEVWDRDVAGPEE